VLFAASQRRALGVTCLWFLLRCVIADE